MAALHTALSMLHAVSLLPLLPAPCPLLRLVASRASLPPQPAASVPPPACCRQPAATDVCRELVATLPLACRWLATAAVAAGSFSMPCILRGRLDMFDIPLLPASSLYQLKELMVQDDVTRIQYDC